VQRVAQLIIAHSSPFLRYTDREPNARTRAVSYRDWEGLEHSVEVTANSLYEAAVLGLGAFRESSHVEHCGPGPAGLLRVTVKAEESHEVKVQQLKAVAQKRREVAPRAGAQDKAAGAARLRRTGRPRAVHVTRAKR
jgi:hypothetical protein